MGSPAATTRTCPPPTAPACLSGCRSTRAGCSSSWLHWLEIMRGHSRPRLAHAKLHHRIRFTCCACLPFVKSAAGGMSLHGINEMIGAAQRAGQSGSKPVRATSCVGRTASPRATMGLEASAAACLALLLPQPACRLAAAAPLLPLLLPLVLLLHCCGHQAVMRPQCRWRRWPRPHCPREWLRRCWPPGCPGRCG